MIKGTSKNNYQIVENRELAIKLAIKSLNKDAIVVILGKGHENYQIIKDEKHYFNDYEIAKNIYIIFSQRRVTWH